MSSGGGWNALRKNVITSGTGAGSGAGSGAGRGDARDVSQGSDNRCVKKTSQIS